jgi:hypothetical protein
MLPLPIEGRSPSLTRDCCLNELMAGRGPELTSPAADEEVAVEMGAEGSLCLGKDSLLSTIPERDLTLLDPPVVLLEPTDEEWGGIGGGWSRWFKDCVYLLLTLSWLPSSFNENDPPMLSSPPPPAALLPIASAREEAMEESTEGCPSEASVMVGMVRPIAATSRRQERE